MWAAFQEANRLCLLEVACSPDSVLSEAAEKMGKTAFRAMLSTGHDLTQPEGIRKILQVIKKQRPLHVWISTECGPFSPMQNLNQRNPQQKLDLQEKQRAARKQHLGGLVVAYYASKMGAHVHWEWARRCRAWKWEHIDRWRNRLQTYTAIVGGCRVGLVDPKSGDRVGKEWRVESTCEQFARQLHLPCQGHSCEGNHTRCEGSLTRASAFYTSQFARRALHYMVKCEAPGKANKKLQEWWQGCHCQEFKDRGQVQVCSSCIMGGSGRSHAWVGEEAPAGANPPEQAAPEGEDQVQGFTPEEKRKWLHKIGLLHSATGHGSREQLKHALQQKGVDARVVALVDSFRCSACEERKRPAPRRAATLEVHPDRWKVALVDTAIWVHPQSKKRHVIGLFMDQCSRFIVGKVLLEHKTQQPSADMYLQLFQEQWQQYFGRPETLRFDSEGAWRSRELDEAFNNLGIMLDPIPGDAHWHLSPLERAIAWIKECLSKLSAQDPESSVKQLVSSALEAWNNREICRGFTPRQDALGQAPDACGRLFETEVTKLPSK